MAIRIITVTNISHQVVNLLYGNIVSGDSRSRLPYNEAGELCITPGANIELEESRLDQGQLESFRRKGLITTVVR